MKYGRSCPGGSARSSGCSYSVHFLPLTAVSWALNERAIMSEWYLFLFIVCVSVSCSELTSLVTVGECSNRPSKFHGYGIDCPARSEIGRREKPWSKPIRLLKPKSILFLPSGFQPHL